ncbi:MAG: arylsulfatase [Bacteroidota bacterium]
MKRTYLLLILLFLFSCQNQQKLGQQSDTKENSERPNIIIMLVDDMGFSDLGCYGGEIETPNLDKLGKEGIRFTQFYNTARCCPTRASLLTGLYPHQAGIGQMTGDKGASFPGYRGQVGKDAVTIAEVLKTSNYQTGMVGKWHVSRTKQIKPAEEHLKWLNHQDYLDKDFSDPTTYPTARGFDKYYGNIWGVVNFFDPFGLVNGTEPVKEVPEDYYITDAISDTAVAYIDQFTEKEEPFFLYVAHCAPHWPLHALPEDIAKYKDTYTVGWDSIRESRFQRQMELGLFEEGEVSLSPHTPRPKEWVNESNQEWEARAMAVHAAMIDRIDQGMGRILQKLEEKGELDNTIILFLSDNGASPERPKNGGFDRNSETRSGETVAYSDFNVLPGPENSYNGIGRYWANVANTPFRIWKSKTFEGGICTPMIAYWKNGITDQAGTVSQSPGHVVDLMATCLDLSEASYPEMYEGHSIKPLEGKSLVPVFENGTRSGHETIFFEHFYAKALRQGDWKLVAFPNNEWELYNLKEDRTEMNNLAEQMPEKVEELVALWEKRANETNVFPQPEQSKFIKNFKRPE